ncbi:MAG TPA: superoxide dismutase family protein [Gemmataceae bacterium]|nr:superoxide dismutase family protein [Gemmataceae bacterium]
MTRIAAVTLALLGTALWVSAHNADQEGSQPSGAIAVMHGLGNNHVHGTVTFTQDGDEIEVHIHLAGLTPGEHAFHIHEFGDCSSNDGMSAGGHFNPEHHQHGHRTRGPRHVGDLGNIKADDQGNVDKTFKDKVIKLSGPHSILGRSVIVHEKADEYTQPVGNAGGRVACGVVGIANPKTKK